MIKDLSRITRLPTQLKPASEYRSKIEQEGGFTPEEISEILKTKEVAPSSPQEREVLALLFAICHTQCHNSGTREIGAGNWKDRDRGTPQEN